MDLLSFFISRVEFDVGDHFSIIGMYMTIAVILFALGELRSTLDQLLKKKENITHTEMNSEEKDVTTVVFSYAISEYEDAFKYLATRFLYSIGVCFFGIFLGVLYSFNQYMYLFLLFLMIYSILSCWIIGCGYRIIRIYNLSKSTEATLRNSEDKSKYPGIFDEIKIKSD